MTAAARDLRRRFRTTFIRRRRGFVLLSTIVCLMIASAVTANVMRRVVRQRRESRLRHWENQASWLALAGARKAAATLAADPDYDGETWQPQFDDDGDDVAMVVIERTPGRLKITADYPYDATHLHQRARHTIELPLRSGPSP